MVKISEPIECPLIADLTPRAGGKRPTGAGAHATRDAAALQRTGPSAPGPNDLLVVPDGAEHVPHGTDGPAPQVRPRRRDRTGARRHRARSDGRDRVHRPPPGRREDRLAEYVRTRSTELRNELVVAYLPFCRQIAARVVTGLPSWVERDDLVQFGVFGLMNALDGYDPNRGSFRRFARKHVSGAMYDGLRAQNWTPSRDIEEQPTIVPIPQSWPVCRPDVLERDLRNALEQLTDLEQPANTVDPRSEADLILANCNDTERRFLEMYYYERLTLREIGEVNGYSESRACQIHSAIIARLKQDTYATVLSVVAESSLSTRRPVQRVKVPGWLYAHMETERVYQGWRSLIFVVGHAIAELKKLIASGAGNFAIAKAPLGGGKDRTLILPPEHAADLHALQLRLRSNEGMILPAQLLEIAWHAYEASS